MLRSLRSSLVEGAGMTLDQLAENFNNATNQTDRLQTIKDFTASRASLPKAPERAMTNSEFYAEIDALESSKRTSLMQLRHRHLEKIDRIAKRPHFDRASYQEYMVENYDRLFGPLRRPKINEVPFDQFRKRWMVSMLLDRIEARRGYFKKRNLI